MIASFLAGTVESDPEKLLSLKGTYVATSTSMFNIGGLIGTLSTVFVAEKLGRQKMYLIYFLLSAISIFSAFSPIVPLPAYFRLLMMFPVGLFSFGVFGSFTFYLPELFPLEIRGFACGFCYNSGRLLTAIGPFIIGIIVKSGVNSLSAIQWVSVVAFAGAMLALLKVPVETMQVQHLNFDHEESDGEDGQNYMSPLVTKAVHLPSYTG